MVRRSTSSVLNVPAVLYASVLVVALVEHILYSLSCRTPLSDKMATESKLHVAYDQLQRELGTMMPYKTKVLTIVNAQKTNTHASGVLQSKYLLLYLPH